MPDNTIKRLARRFNAKIGKRSLTTIAHIVETGRIQNSVFKRIL